MSASITSIKDSVDTVLTIYGPDGQVIASNDDQFEPSDSSIFDLKLPATGAYVVEVDAFHSTDPMFNDPSSPNFNPAAFYDAQHGHYELFMYSFASYNGTTGNDVIYSAGPGLSITPGQPVSQPPALRRASSSRAINVAVTPDSGLDVRDQPRTATGFASRPPAFVGHVLAWSSGAAHVPG